MSDTTVKQTAMMVEELLMQRSTYKALVTKSSRTLSCLIKEGDINLIKKHGVMMKAWFHSFDDVCESYLEMLTDETDITDAESYYDAVYDDYMDQLDSLNYAMDSFTMQAPAVVQRTDSNTTLSTMSPIINLPKMVREQETKSPIQPVQSVVQSNETVLINTHNCTCQPLPSQQVQEDINNNVNVSYKQYLTNPTDARFQFEEVSVDTIMQLISKLKSKDTKGHDLISNNLLKAIKHEIVKPLTFIINQSLKTGTFPDRLKVARVRPLFKKGDNQLITNYRPISILPSLSKIFEKVMHMQLTYYLESNSLMATTQYGYRSGHSTELASLELVDRIYGHLENNDIPCAVFCDLSKAFDCLSHPILLGKLEYYGIRGIPLQLIKSYLQNRTQFVQINSTMSTTTSINIGIPQGSVLGPLFFNICINDIKNCTNKFDIVSYADDTTLISTIDSFTSPNTNISDNINSELENVNKWLAAQKLCLNVLKTKYMMFHTPQKRIPELHLSINNIDIEKVDSFNFLGLVLDTHLKWNFHVRKVANKLTHINWILSKLKHIFPQKILKTIYSSLIESHINYCLVLWGTNYDRIFKLQKKAVRTISLAHYKSHTSPLFKSLGILNIKDMYNIGLLKLYFKIKNGTIPLYFHNFLVTENVPVEPQRYNFRHERRVIIPIPPREYQKRNTKYQLRQLVLSTENCILQRVEHYSIHSFVNYCRQYYLNNYRINCDIENCYSCNYH